MLILALPYAEETNCKKLHKIDYRGLMLRKDSSVVALITISIRLTTASDIWLLDGTLSASKGDSQLGKSSSYCGLTQFSFSPVRVGLSSLNSSDLDE